MTPADIITKYQSVKGFMQKGGITVTGGEPLLQIDFLTELFVKCKELKIHTCLDTSGITFTESTKPKIDKLMEVCDLVMLDFKHIEDEGHKELTGLSNKNILAFAKYLADIKKDMWARHVLVPGITNDDELLEKLGYFLGDLRNLKRLEVLPYHTMGSTKYKQLGMDVPLKGVPEATAEQAEHAKEVIMQGVIKKLKEKKTSKK